MRWVPACALVAILACGGVARADDSTGEESSEAVETKAAVRPSTRVWYGYETLLVDTALIGVFATCPVWPQFDGEGVMLAADAVGFAFATPMIHGLRGHGETGGVSLLLHAGLPFALMWPGMFIGASMRCGCPAGDWLCMCGLTNAAWGAYGGILAGAGLGAVLDAALLAWEPRAPKPWTLSWSIAPFAVHGGGGLGAAGTF